MISSWEAEVLYVMVVDKCRSLRPVWTHWSVRKITRWTSTFSSLSVSEILTCIYAPITSKQVNVRFSCGIICPVSKQVSVRFSCGIICPVSPGKSYCREYYRNMARSRVCFRNLHTEEGGKDRNSAFELEQKQINRYCKMLESFRIFGNH